MKKHYSLKAIAILLIFVMVASVGQIAALATNDPEYNPILPSITVEYSDDTEFYNSGLIDRSVLTRLAWLLNGDVIVNNGTLSTSNTFDAYYWTQSNTRNVWFQLVSSNTTHVATLGAVTTTGTIILTDIAIPTNTNIIVNDLGSVPSGFLYWCIVVQASTYNGQGYTLSIDKSLSPVVGSVQILDIPSASVATYPQGTHFRVNGNSTVSIYSSTCHKLFGYHE